MKVLVFNGSPKGQKSVTLQSVSYLKKTFPADTFEVVDVASRIRAFEDQNKFAEFTKGIKDADLILLSYPVYTFLAPAQYHRFFELMLKNGKDFCAKPVTQLTTSKHFYDVTAHDTIKAIVGDLKGRYIGGLSADMEDLLEKRGREQLTDWWKYVTFQVNNNICKLPEKTQKKEPNIYNKKAENFKIFSSKKTDKKVIIVTDAVKGSSVMAMAEDFAAVMPYQTEIFNLHDFDFKCGCLGCLKCAIYGKCAVNDGFEQLLNDKINKYDSIVMAFEITNHAMSSLYKTFYDRQFVNGHRPVNAGKPTAYLVSGNLSGEPTLQMYIDAKSSIGVNLNCGTVCDETATFEDIKTTAAKLSYALENPPTPSTNFYEVGGMKIFRDMIWIMRGLMKDDYAFYKKSGRLDFPQKKRGKMYAMKFVGALARSKFLSKKVPDMLSDGMLMPYEKHTK